jgi:hypothetical protein
MTIVPHENYPNYCDYQDLFDEWTYPQLCEAWEAIHCSDKAEKLYEEESTLLVFLVDTQKQEQLFLFFEDKQNYQPTYDW